MGLFFLRFGFGVIAWLVRRDRRLDGVEVIGGHDDRTIRAPHFGDSLIHLDKQMVGVRAAALSDREDPEVAIMPGVVLDDVVLFRVGTSLPRGRQGLRSRGK